MNDMMGIILTNKEDISLRELTAERSIAALPVLGRYRLIDFPLSSLVNSGVRNVGVIIQKNYHSLMEHLGSGKEWDLNTHKDGLFLLPPYSTNTGMGSNESTLEALASNIGYLRNSTQQYVLLLPGYILFNTNFEDMLRFHIDSKSDITMLYAKANTEARISSAAVQEHVYVRMDKSGIVKEMEIGPNLPSWPDMSMSAFLLRRTLLIHLLDQAISRGMTQLHRDLINPYVKNGQLKVMGYEYKGYYRAIESISGYFHFHMDMLDSGTRRAFYSNQPVYTRVRDEVPARYTEGSQCVNSLIADGCVIEGTVINSVLFRGTHVRRGAVVRNSVLMQEADIQDGVEVENVILDKAVTIRTGRLIGQKSYPIVIEKNMTL